MSLFLHAQRIDVLHALALVAGGREALPDGLERLAADDRLLAPWARQLAPALRRGDQLPEVLRRARLLSRSEAAALAADSDAAAGLARLAEAAAAPPRGLWLVRWFPSMLLTVAAAGYAVGMLAQRAFGNIAQELGIRMATWDQTLLGLLAAILGMILLQFVLFRLRGLRHLQHLWCPEVHRTAAWREFVLAVRLGDAPVPLGRIASLLAPLRIPAQRRAAPAWDLPWRTWLMLTRFRMSATQRRQLAAETSGRIRLEQLGGDDPAALDLAIGAAWPFVTATLWLVGAAGLILGFAEPLLSIVQQLNSF